MQYLYFLMTFVLLINNVFGYADNAELKTKSKHSSRLPDGVITAEEYAKKYPSRGKFFEGSQQFTFPDHPFLGKQFASFQNFPKTFILTIPKGRTLLGAGIVITPDNRLLRDTAVEWDRTPEKHRIFEKKQLPEKQKYKEQVAVVSSTSAHCYYHWMFDVLPKFKILEDAGIKPDLFYLQYDELPFQKETLEILGIDKNLLVKANSKTHIEAKTLIVPSLAGLSICPPKWVYDFLRSKFLINPPNEHTQRVYVSRGMAATRRIFNEGEVIHLLEAYGFKMYYLEKMSLVEQAKLFASAKIIITPHGSALTNLAFCSPKTHLIEIFPPNGLSPCFWHVSQQMEVHHICMLGNQEGLDADNVRREDMLVDTKKLEEQLKQLLCD